MPFDRAGYLNNFGGYGNYGRFNQGAACGRINDCRLLKKELHYVETYAKNYNADCGAFNNSGCYDNCGYGYGGRGFNDCGFGPGCEVGCGSGRGFDGPCGGFDGPCGGFGGPCGSPCGLVGPFDGPYRRQIDGDFDDHDEGKKHKKNKNKDDKPCNPFCKPCKKREPSCEPFCVPRCGPCGPYQEFGCKEIKRECPVPHETSCGCNNCAKSLKKIYGN